jgi:protein-tyrosine-phosphatase
VPNPTLPPAVREVLFVCTGNSCRSVMAEYLFNKMAADKGLSVRAHSAGVAAPQGSGPSFETLEVLKLDGIDARRHSSRMVHEDMMESSDMVLALTEQHAAHLKRHFPENESKVYLMTEFYAGDDRALFIQGIPDPIGMNHHFYKNTYLVIRACVDTLVKQLAAAGKKSS